MDVRVSLSGHIKCISYCGLVSKSPEGHCNGRTFCHGVHAEKEPEVASGDQDLGMFVLSLK